MIVASADKFIAVRGLTDGRDQLIEADDPLAQLQMLCGGTVPGTLAVPELYEMVNQSRLKGLRLAREFHAFDGNDKITGFVRISPQAGADGDAGRGTGGCELMIENWRQDEHLGEDDQVIANRLDDIDRMVADLTARLDADLRIMTAETGAPDLAECAQQMTKKPRQMWSDFIDLVDDDYRKPLHWRLIDGARAKIAGSQRDWRIRLMPLGLPSEVPYGFELLLVSEQPWFVAVEPKDSSDAKPVKIGETLASVLRQPISRIIANAETIRSRLAGPLRQEYADYAGDIASAGSHLLALLDDMADLEAVEAEGFAVSADQVDLADAARRAAGILGMKSSAKSITVELPEGDNPVIGKAEFRRVLQILINLIGNAVNYSPEGSAVRITLAQDKQVSVTVSDEGPGLSEDDQARVFSKFERLGREGDGGSGLGLYISQRLARAMEGELTVSSVLGEGAHFTLTLPKA